MKVNLDKREEERTERGKEGIPRHTARREKGRGGDEGGRGGEEGYLATDDSYFRYFGVFETRKHTGVQFG
jgi:hypothetical protein